MMAENVEDMVGLPSLDNQGPDAGLAMQQPRSAKPALSKGIKKESKKCPHGKQKSVCSDCGGSGLCQHGRRKSKCTKCQTLAEIAGLDVSKIMSCGLAPRLMKRPDGVQALTPRLMNRLDAAPVSWLPAPSQPR